MRLAVAFIFLALALPLSSAFASDDARADLLAALKTFRTDGPRGWSFTQITESGGEKRVERFDPAQPEFTRWSLLELNGRVPTTDELHDYRQKVTRRSSATNAPHLTNQFDLSSLELVRDSADRTTWRCRLQPTEAGDATAEHLAATLIFHRPTHTIESVEIASTEPFAPTLGVKITELNTTLTYSLPDADRPSLLLQSTTRLRGRAFFFKSLDADMSVTFTDHQKAGRR
jgi:hypothetical protein